MGKREIKRSVDAACRRAAEEMVETLRRDYARHVTEFELRQSRRIVDAAQRRLA